MSPQGESPQGDTCGSASRWSEYAKRAAYRLPWRRLHDGMYPLEANSSQHALFFPTWALIPATNHSSWGQPLNVTRTIMRGYIGNPPFTQKRPLSQEIWNAPPRKDSNRRRDQRLHHRRGHRVLEQLYDIAVHPGGRRHLRSQTTQRTGCGHKVLRH